MIPGFDKEETCILCKLKKSLYGLKQSDRVWFDRFAKVTRKHSYQQGQSDHILFFKQNGNEKRTILVVCVDDIVLTGDNLEESERLK